MIRRCVAGETAVKKPHKIVTPGFCLIAIW